MLINALPFLTFGPFPCDSIEILQSKVLCASHWIRNQPRRQHQRIGETRFSFQLLFMMYIHIAVLIADCNARICKLLSLNASPTGCCLHNLLPLLMFYDYFNEHFDWVFEVIRLGLTANFPLLPSRYIIWVVYVLSSDSSAHYCWS